MQYSSFLKRTKVSRVPLLHIFSILLIAMLLVPAPASAQKGDPPGQLVQLQLLAFNDYHGYLEAGSNPGPGMWPAPPLAGASTSQPN